LLAESYNELQCPMRGLNVIIENYGLNFCSRKPKVMDGKQPISPYNLRSQWMINL